MINQLVPFTEVIATLLWETQKV